MKEKLRHPTKIINRSGPSKTTVTLVGVASGIVGFTIGLFAGFTIYDELLNRNEKEKTTVEH